MVIYLQLNIFSYSNFFLIGDMFLFFCAKSSEDNEAFIVNLIKMDKFRCHHFNKFLVCKLGDFSFQVVEL